MNGNLINICTATEQRIYAVFPDVPYAYPSGYVSPVHVNLSGLRVWRRVVTIF